MKDRYEPINPKCSHFLHGGDYNPDQWLKTKEIWNEDMRLMKLANCNAVSLGIFSWSALEPEEGKFTFEWMDEIFDKLHKNGVYVTLATPSGARPAWISQKYPEVLRVQPNRVRNLHGMRHNHCYTSPVYREKTAIINQKLAERYHDHPALILWHISNEFGGECHCPLCQEAFCDWLKAKYNNDLDKLNEAWYTSFWSHQFTDWAQIESPAPHGEFRVHALALDWRRFVTDQTVDFYRNEVKAIRAIDPHTPVTTNFMGVYEPLNYWKFANDLDVVSWDSYPWWHSDGKQTWETAIKPAFEHDINRSMKGGKPFMLIECTPSLVNWQPINKLKRPGMNMLSSMQAAAHGSDSILYFQWRKSRGSSEKFHGAVVDHSGSENTRVFNDVREVGEALKKLDDVVGTTVRPEVAIIHDWENRWAINECQALRQDKKEYLETCMNHYKGFWKRGVPVDVIDMDCDFDKYKLLVAPMLYMLRPGVADRIDRFVQNGGTFVTTYWSGIVDENDLCFLGGFPGPLRKVMGIWSEEIDTLQDTDENWVVFNKDNDLKLTGRYKAGIFCDLIHAETAKVLAAYEKDFYAGRPALTVNSYGKGKAYYISARCEDSFHCDFYSKLVDESGIRPALDTTLPTGVTAQLRTDGETEYIFVMNFNDEAKEIILNNEIYEDFLSGGRIVGNITLKPYGALLLKKRVSAMPESKGCSICSKG